MPWGRTDSEFAMVIVVRDAISGFTLYAEKCHSESFESVKDILQYIERLLNMEISQEEINSILKKIGIDYDAWPITKIIIENDLKLNKLFLKLK